MVDWMVDQWVSDEVYWLEGSSAAGLVA
jgi:hypothetical protein